ncbi:methyltransferase domain-containing protein [Lacibacterium aquatile]|uniref:Methyltransferase domain-containing protein n=1 Tax=Lacibacterium aquatile TaxID=1168082 RepID=A0ABW5DKE1_9PROT
MLRLLQILERIAADKSQIRILDLGGTLRYWSLLPPDTLERLDLSITLVNLPGSVPLASRPRFHLIEGDACNLIDHPDASFDLVHSNSVIEHVGDWARMQAFAGEVHRLAPHYFIQTPDWAFPVEPHFMTPFFHWLPRNARMQLVQRAALGHMRRARSATEAAQIIDDARLLSYRQMSILFPHARIERERFLGWPKSLIAIH